MSMWQPATGPGEDRAPPSKDSTWVGEDGATRSHKASFPFSRATGTYLRPSDSTSSSYVCCFPNEKMKTLFPSYSPHAKEPEPLREADSGSEASDVGGSGPC